MTYLITQTFFLLLIAGLLGLILGWYLTRLAGNGARAALQTRLQNAEADARKLRGELDAAVTARGQSEADRQQCLERVAKLEASAGDPAGLAMLQAELDQCRDALAAAADQGASEPDEEPADEAPAPPASEPQPAPLAAMAAPAAAGDGEPDDLQRIKGIGPKIAGILNGLGIVRFDQIAAWTPENVAWVNDHLQFKGRIEREEWIPQAQAFIAQRDK
ncbi:MAG: hypothetical protein KDI82_03635 [Gammaproteobacteria bacterium]|nr:hypothetical protein [Gammaproteobacteria bacterium]